MSQTKVIVSYPAVRNIFIQKELGEDCSHWMMTLQEYDLEIKPVKIVRGQGLCKMATEVASKENPEEGGWENEAAMYEIDSMKVI